LFQLLAGETCNKLIKLHLHDIVNGGGGDDGIGDPLTTHTSCGGTKKKKMEGKKYVSQAASRALPLPPPFPTRFAGPKTSNDRSHAASCGNPHFHALVAFSFSFPFSFSCAPLLSRPKIQDTDRQFIL